MYYLQKQKRPLKMLINNLTFYQYIPGACIVFSIFLSVFTGIQSFAYISIFYWSVLRFDFLPISLLVGMGLIYDSISSHLLGEETLTYLVLIGIVYLDRRFLLHRDFNYLWKNLSILVTMIAMVKWTLALQLDFIFSVEHQLFDTLIGILSFPLYVSIIAPIYNRFATL